MADLRMPDLNTVIIAGNLTNDPTFGETTEGTTVVNFYLASNRRYKDNKGQLREDVCFVGVVAWDALASSCRGRLFRGSSVLISGELQSRKWKSDDGHNRTIVEIKARKIQFLDKGKKEFEGNDAEVKNDSKPEPDDNERKGSEGDETKEIDRKESETAPVENEESEPVVETETSVEKADDSNGDGNAVEMEDESHSKSAKYDFGYKDLKL